MERFRLIITDYYEAPHFLYTNRTRSINRFFPVGISRPSVHLSLKRILLFGKWAHWTMGELDKDGGVSRLRIKSSSSIELAGKERDRLKLDQKIKEEEYQPTWRFTVRTQSPFEEWTFTMAYQQTRDIMLDVGGYSTLWSSPQFRTWYTRNQRRR